MSQSRHLRSVGPNESQARAPGGPPARAPRLSILLLVLTGVLAAAVLYLVWNRAALESRLDRLEAETLALQAEVERGERMIQAQASRLDEVRVRLEGLRDILDEPLPSE